MNSKARWICLASFLLVWTVGRMLSIQSASHLQLYAKAAVYVALVFVLALFIRGAMTVKMEPECLQLPGVSHEGPAYPFKPSEWIIWLVLAVVCLVPFTACVLAGGYK